MSLFLHWLQESLCWMRHPLAFLILLVTRQRWSWSSVCHFYPQSWTELRHLASLWLRGRGKCSPWLGSHFPETSTLHGGREHSSLVICKLSLIQVVKAEDPGYVEEKSHRIIEIKGKGGKKVLVTLQKHLATVSKQSCLSSETDLLATLLNKCLYLFLGCAMQHVGS